MSKAKPTLHKVTPATESKPQETPQEIILRAQKCARRTVEQINGLEVFCFNVDEGGAVYDFSCGMHYVLEAIGRHAGEIIETLDAATAELQKGGAR